MSARSSSQLEADRARLDPGARVRFAAHSAGWKSRSAGVPTMHTRPQLARVAGRHRLGHQRRRAQRAERRRQQQVALELADVAVAGSGPAVDGRVNHAQRLADRLAPSSA